MAEQTTVRIIDLTDEVNSPPVLEYTTEELPLVGDLIKCQDEHNDWHRLIVHERCWEVERNGTKTLVVHCKVHQ